MERQKGLMFETHLGDKEGMLFVFTDDRIHSFWMKNTFLTLDLIFIDSGGAVVDFLEMLPPCPTGPCPTYSSRRPARYALEMKGGSIQRYGLQKGNLIRFQF